MITEPQVATLEDRHLVARVVAGDTDAFEAIYDRYSAQVFGLALRISGGQRAAEEATQDAFLSLWRTAGSYDACRGTLRTWLLSVVRHRAIDGLRRDARHAHPVEIDGALVGHLEAAERPDEQLAINEESRVTRQLLVSLPAEQRQVIELAYFSGLSSSEIAVEVGIPLGTVKGRQRLALTKLRRTVRALPAR